VSARRYTAIEAEDRYQYVTVYEQRATYVQVWP
jgi:hypothetical protein